MPPGLPGGLSDTQQHERCLQELLSEGTSQAKLDFYQARYDERIASKRELINEYPQLKMDRCYFSDAPEEDWQPSLNTDIEVTQTDIRWPDYEQKVYSYVLWLRYLIRHFLSPWGYELSGCVFWEGESEKDFGSFAVYDGEVVVSKQRLPTPPWNHFRANRFLLYPALVQKSLIFAYWCLHHQLGQPRDIAFKIVGHSVDEAWLGFEDPDAVATEKGYAEKTCSIM